MLKKLSLFACLIFLIITSIIFYKHNLTPERPDNELPMYGGEYDPEVQPDKENSQSAAKLGWQYYYQGDYDTAIKRFNQAWMSDRNSAHAYWGFGVIMGHRANTDEDPRYHLIESIKHLTKALSLEKDNPRIMVDLAIPHTGFGYYKQRYNEGDENKQFTKANNLFKKAKELDPDYPLLWLNWSYLKNYEGDINTAKKYLQKAIDLGANPPKDYIKDLERAK